MQNYHNAVLSIIYFLKKITTLHQEKNFTFLQRDVNVKNNVKHISKMFHFSPSTC